MAYVKSEKVYATIDYMRAKGMLDDITVEYHTDRGMTYFVELTQERDGERRKITVNLFNPEILGFMKARDLHPMFDALFHMPSRLAPSGYYQATPTPTGYVEDFTIHSKKVELMREIELRPGITRYFGLKYSFLDDRVITFEWLHTFELMPYYDIPEMEKFLSDVPKIVEELKQIYLRDRDEWMKSFKDIRFKIF